MSFKFYPIYRRELRSYLTSPAVYAFAALWFFLSGLIFYGIITQFADASVSAEVRRNVGLEKVNYTLHVVGQLFLAMHFLLIFLVPIFTMRLLAEEKRSGTFELLKSLPFTDHDIVAGKFLAAYTLVTALILGSLVYVLVMWRYGQPEMPVVAVAYAGVLLASAGYVAIGLFASAVTENQIVAAIVAFVALLAFFLIGDITLPASSGWTRVLELLSLRYHTEHFTRGLLRLEDMVFFALLVLAFLFLTCRALELRRWRI